MSIYLFYSNNSYVLLLCPNVVTPSTYTICVLSKVLKIFDGELISVRFMFLNGNISLFKNSYFLRKGHRLFQEDARAPLAPPDMPLKCDDTYVLYIINILRWQVLTSLKFI